MTVHNAPRGYSLSPLIVGGELFSNRKFHHRSVLATDTVADNARGIQIKAPGTYLVFRPVTVAPLFRASRAKSRAECLEVTRTYV